MRITLILLAIFSFSLSNAQEISILLHKKYPVSSGKPEINYSGINKGSNPVAKYNPVSLFFDGSMYLYQHVISEQISSECTFYPSCSEFSKKLIQNYGLLKGIFLTADRLTRCNGHASDEYPFWQVDQNNLKVVDIIERYRWRNLY